MLTIFQDINHYVHCLDCGPSWTIYNNLASSGSYSVGSKSLSDCQNVCVENFNCVAVDHNFNDGTCWIHELEKDIVVRDLWFVYSNQYKLNTRCDWSCKSTLTLCQWYTMAWTIGATLVGASFVGARFGESDMSYSTYAADSLVVLWVQISWKSMLTK